MKNFKYIAIAALGLVACEPELDNSVEDAGFYSSGDANLSKFVSVGNSLTAGYADGTLYVAGQNNSFPNILAGQFAKAGGGIFKQPLVNDNVGGLLLNGTVSDLASNRLILDESPLGIMGPAPIAGTPSTEISNRLVGAFNNMGVPSVKSYEVAESGLGALSNVNTFTAPAYYSRFASSDTSSILDDAMAQAPTFFTFWIGSNDVLLYALHGGDGVDQLGNTDTNTYGQEDITDPTVFADSYTAALQTMTSGGAKGIVCNLPSVTDIPYFTTVPYAPLDPTNPDFGPQIPTLNGIFGQLNQVYAFLGFPERSIVFSETAPSAVVIKDETLVDLSAQITAVLNANPGFPAFVQSFGLPAAASPIVANLLGTTYGQTRQTNANDMLVLPSSGVIGTVNETSVSNLMTLGLPEALAIQFSAEGITYPLEDKWVLIPMEQTLVANAQSAYNTTIKSLADADDNVAFVDMQAFLNQLNNGGISYDAGVVTSTYASGGGFSLDGVHPTARGYSLIANIMIDEINSSFNATIPKVNPAYYPTVYID